MYERSGQFALHHSHWLHILREATLVEKQIDSLPNSILDPHSDHRNLSHCSWHSHSLDTDAHPDDAKVLFTCLRIGTALLPPCLSLYISLHMCIAVNTVDSYPCSPHWHSFIDIFHLFLHASKIYIGQLLDDNDEKRRANHEVSFAASYDVFFVNFICF